MGDEASLDLAECTKFAYTYAFPLVMMKQTYDQETQFVQDGEFYHHREYSNPANRTVVLPNIDTLYSRAWLNDLSTMPVVFNIPEIKLPDGKDRYCLFPIIDAFTNVVASPGLRTKKELPYPAEYVLVGPNYTGVIPDGLTRIDMPSDIAWIFGRIQTFGESDYKNVHKIQDALTLTRLDKWPRQLNYSVHTTHFKATPVAESMQLDCKQFFKRFSELWPHNPSLPADKPFLSKLVRVNLIQGQLWNPSSFTPSDLEIIETAFQYARAHLATSAYPLLDEKNFWSINSGCVAAWGNNYILRAFIALVGIGINIVEDSMFPNAKKDATGTLFDASAKYKLVMDDLPPVNGFWSITIYDKDGFLIPNDSEIYAVGDSYCKIHPGPVVIWIQQTKPADLAPNNFWLPAPPPSADGSVVRFQLTLRMYWPKQAAIDGTWWINGVQKVE